MKLLNKAVDGLCKLVMGSSAAIVLVITFAQVVCRYVLKSPLPWSQDVLRLAFTYLVFWGAAWCTKEKGHLNVDVVLTMMKPKVRLFVEFFINLVLVVFFILMIYQGYKFAVTGLTQKAPYLPIPMTCYYASIPTAGLLMLYYMVQILFEQVKEMFKKEG